MTRESLAIKLQAGSSRVAGFLAQRPDWFIERFAKMPTTNFLFLLVGYLSIRTGEHYMRTPGWEPSTEWLGFIVGMSSASVFQWVKKRTTDHEYVRAQRGEVLPSVSEEGSARVDDI